MENHCLESLRKKRRDLNYSQEYVAEKLGITQKAYSDLENGKTYLKSTTLLKLSSLFEVPINKLCNISCYCDSNKKLKKILKYLKDNDIELPENYI